MSLDKKMVDLLKKNLPALEVEAITNLIDENKRYKKEVRNLESRVEDLFITIGDKNEEMSKLRKEIDEARYKVISVEIKEDELNKILLEAKELKEQSLSAMLEAEKGKTKFVMDMTQVMFRNTVYRNSVNKCASTYDNNGRPIFDSEVNITEEDVPLN